ncbi:hypothetical protein O1V64_16940 [Rouxiella badensis]|nr:hypothetical protein O1V64_16940 [Rouxiella badensis]
MDKNMSMKITSFPCSFAEITQANSLRQKQRLYGVQNERYKVCPEKCADGHWYLIGYCGACPDIPLDEKTNLLIHKNIKPMM